MTVLETNRLRLRRLTPADAPFILELLNEPSYLQFIGDRGVRTLDDARAYIENGPMAMYARYGHGLYLVLLKEGEVPLGMCGLIQRAGLDDVDLGYALRPPYWSQGYASEAAAAVLDYGRRELGLRRIVAIVSPENDRSIKLLEKLGLSFERMFQLPGNSVALQLLAWEAPG